MKRKKNNGNPRNAAIAVVAVAIALIGIYWLYANSKTVQPTSVVNCGEVVMLGPNPPADKNASTIESCFLMAYKNTQNATMLVDYMGVDTSELDNFTIIHNAGSTAIRDVQTQYNANFGGNESKSTFICTSLNNTYDPSFNGYGLLISSCSAGSGDYFVANAV